MKNKILKMMFLSLFVVLFYTTGIFAAKLDPSIPIFDADTLSLNSDGTASFAAPVYLDKFKRYELQLLKRVTSYSASTGIVYTYKTHGGVVSVDPAESEFVFNITSTGYYQFQIRGVNLEGNYGEWIAIYDNSTWVNDKTHYPGVPVDEENISPGGGGSSGTGGIGSGTNNNYGPGVVQQGNLPYGYQYVIIGPNGEIIYNYGNNYNYQNQGNYAQYGPGYYSNANGGSGVNLYPNTGVSNFPQVTAPNVNYGYDNSSNYIYSGQNNQNGQTNPNYYNGGTSNNNNSPNNNNNISGSPQITQGLEIGWHVDSNGRFYYQGNGVVLKGTWYLIDGSYYRFSEHGYLLANQWYKDNTTGYWYYLGGDGKMLVGWQCINGTWYYFKPENGNGYGTMYMNTALQITDNIWGTGYYAFDANGATVMNAWYGGYYYGRDGKRTN